MWSLPRIESLADEGSLERGRDCFRRGLVLRVTVRSDGSVEGVVEGETFYRVSAGGRCPNTHPSPSRALRRELLALHAELCTQAPPPTATLVDWLVKFQFDGKQDYFNPDVADYSTALGDTGLRRFGMKLAELDAQREAGLADHSETIIRYNQQRLAVAQKDIPAIIASHGDLSRAYRVHDVAKALVEIGAIDLGIEYAERATRQESGFQAERAGTYWCELLHQHRSRDDEGAARRVVFELWPTSANAVALARVAGEDWAALAEDAYARLEERHPRELIETLLGLDLTERAWIEAHRFALGSQLWTRLVAVRQKVDPASVVPVLRELIDTDLEVADARNYKSAV